MCARATRHTKPSIEVEFLIDSESQRDELAQSSLLQIKECSERRVQGKLGTQFFFRRLTYFLD
jgi:hypothetical protein